MSQIRLVAMDIDGTILGKEKKLSLRTREAFEKAAALGIQLVIASGRALQAVPEELLEMDGIEYVISSNGSSIFRCSDGKRIYGRDLTEIQMENLLKIYREYTCPMEIFIGGVPYTEERYYEAPEKYGAPPSSVGYVKTTRKPIGDMTEFVKTHISEIEGINFIVGDLNLKEEMRRCLARLPGIYVTSSAAHYIEVSHGDVCKGNALKWLAGYLGIEQSGIAAFGDGENDLEMILYAGIGVAVENGVEMLKRAADRIAPACEDDGAAEVMLEILGV